MGNEPPDSIIGTDISIDLQNTIAGSDDVLEAINAWKDRWLRKAKSQKDIHTIMSYVDVAIASHKQSSIRRKLVLVVHGIRDWAPWIEKTSTEIANDSTIVQKVDYGFFATISMFLGIGAWYAARVVLKKVHHAIRVHPERDLMIIAHSYGTHVVCNLLLKNPSIVCNRIILCGAVVSRDFDFPNLFRSPLSIINECGDRDIWPVLAAGFSFFFSYSPSGVQGLGYAGICDRYHRSGHSDYLNSEFAKKFWRPFIHDGLIVSSSYQNVRRDIPWAISVLAMSPIMKMVHVALIALPLVAIYWLGYPCISYILLALIVAVLCWFIAKGTWDFLFPGDPIDDDSADSFRSKV